MPSPRADGRRLGTPSTSTIRASPARAGDGLVAEVEALGYARSVRSDEDMQRVLNREDVLATVPTSMPHRCCTGDFPARQTWQCNGGSVRWCHRWRLSLGPDRRLELAWFLGTPIRTQSQLRPQEALCRGRPELSRDEAVTSVTSKVLTGSARSCGKAGGGLGVIIKNNRSCRQPGVDIGRHAVRSRRADSTRQRANCRDGRESTRLDDQISRVDDRRIITLTRSRATRKLKLESPTKMLE